MQLESDAMLLTTGASDFAAVVHSVTDKLMEASERWNALSQMIRRHPVGN
jgi:hypothetical protein